MTDADSVDLSPGFSLYVIYFSIIILWTFLGVFVTESVLLLVTPAVIEWILYLLSIILTYPVPIAGVSWYTKQFSENLKPMWNFVERDVSLNEFKAMVKEYTAAYPQLISKVPGNYLVITIIVAGLSLFVPLIFYQLSIEVAILTPAILGVFLILLGTLLCATILPSMPSSLSNEFPSHSIKKYQLASQFLFEIPGIYWVGIRLTIGEWAGYYTLRKPVLSARIEGIESIAVMTCRLGSDGRILEITFQNESEHSNFPIQSPLSNPSQENLKESIVKVLNWYIELTGAHDIIGEILDEITDK